MIVDNDCEQLCHLLVAAALLYLARVQPTATDNGVCRLVEGDWLVAS